MHEHATPLCDELVCRVHRIGIVHEPSRAAEVWIHENAFGERGVIEVRIFKDNCDWRKGSRFLGEANDVEINSVLQGTTPLLLPA